MTEKNVGMIHTRWITNGHKSKHNQVYKWKVFVRTGWYGSKNHPPDNEAQKPWRKISKVCDPMLDFCHCFFTLLTCVHIFWLTKIHNSKSQIVKLILSWRRKNFFSFSSSWFTDLDSVKKIFRFFLFTTFSPDCSSL